MKGKLAPSETVNMTCVFYPKDNKSWVLKIPCYYYHTCKESGNTSIISLEKKSTLSILCSGAYGTITCEPKNIDFGVILVNTVCEKEIILYNSSECDLNYTLGILEQLEEGVFSKIESTNSKSFIPPNLSVCSSIPLECLSGSRSTSEILPARSRQVLKLRAQPKENRIYNFKLFYSLVAKNSDSNDESPLNLICDVLAQGVQPLVQIMDVKSEGWSKSILWRLLSLDLLNSSLRSISTDPMAYAEFSIDKPMQTNIGDDFKKNFKEMIAFDFGAAPVGHYPTSISLVLKNEGQVPVDWGFYFPNDLQVDLEEWADSGEYTEDQLHENLIIDNNLFQITPKSGHLEPGESNHILLSHTHEFAGFHKLPVLFKLKNGYSRSGKELLINFSGHSVIKSKQFLQIPISQYSFEPIEVGDTHPPVQMYRMINKSSTPLNYQVDAKVLETLKLSNSGFEILHCANMKGVIPANGIVFLEWIFRPLSNASHNIEVPISIKNGQTRVISFSASGYSDDFEVAKQKKDPKIYPDSVPILPMLDFVHETAVLSLERLNFGHSPLGASLRRLVVVQNTSNDSEIVFRWKIPEFWESKGMVLILN